MVEDPDLAELLDRVAGEVPHRSRAALLRELAVIGAEKVSGSREPTVLDRLLSIPGARPPITGAAADGLGGFFEKHPLGEVPQDEPYGASRALDDQRDERL